MASWLLVFIFLLFFSSHHLSGSSIKGINILPVTQAYFFVHFSWICCCLFPQHIVWPRLSSFCNRILAITQSSYSCLQTLFFNCFFIQTWSPVIFQNHSSALVIPLLKNHHLGLHFVQIKILYLLPLFTITSLPGTSHY